jgi:formylglycine-generating enzyme required for sulfatase activity/dienelactone hydrolase
MTESLGDNQEHTPRKAVRQFIDAQLQGQEPDIDEFVRQYPEFENQIRQKVGNLQKIDTLFNSLVQANVDDFGDAATDQDLVGQTLGHFEIRELIGQGGMGVVYLARDTKLDRSVAFKSMPPGLMNNATTRTRFIREAKFLASLSHPNIGVIHDIVEQTDGCAYLVLEYVPGQTLSERTTKGPLTLQEALTIALQIVEAVAAAHEHDIIHRDLKPGNIKITPDGTVKVLDFGLAKTVEGEAADQQSTITEPGRIIGTPAYMSPEQARGKPMDKRSDIWSFGCVLYEMLTGKIPFEGETVSDTLANILDHDPDWQLLPRETGPQVRKMLYKCLEKNPDSRYQSASQIRQDLYNYQATLSAKAFDVRVLWRAIRSPRVPVCIVLILLILGFGLSRLIYRRSKVRWARAEAVPQIMRFIEQDKYLAAFLLARDAEKYIPNDPMLTKLWPRMSKDYSIITTPAGADIFFREFSATEDGWEYLGRAPRENKKLPRGVYRWKFVKEGFENREFVAEGQTLNVELLEEGSFPPGMVRIPSGTVDLNLWPFFQRSEEAVEIPPYWIDQYEVTNEQFKRFVDNGGYEKQEWWKHKFIIDGRELSWEQALKEFRDKTGRPGPSTWEGGTYPKGKEKFPVSGVSWYEAAAYAEFAGKSLPTIYHWQKAACIDQAAVIVPFSNFEGKGLAPVGNSPGIGRTGLYDMAGNVKEWCLNVADVSGDLRYILGGSRGEQTYMFFHADTRPPWNRSSANGFRCVQCLTREKATAGTLSRPVTPPIPRDYSKETPVSDETFNSWLSTLYSYDRTELKAVVEEFDESSDYWRMEKVTFDAAYGGERMIAYLFLPKNVKPPYQTVIYFPGISAVDAPSFEDRPHRAFTDFVIMSGRALVYPVYKGTYEREIVGERPKKPEKEPIAYRDWIIQFSKDLKRSIDYLETRPDFDDGRIAYYGLSWGAWLGPIMMAVEERIKLGILVVGGLPPWKLAPAADPINFAPHVKAPVLIISEDLDFMFSTETSARPLLEFLGNADNKLKPYPGGHGDLSMHFSQQIKADILDWLDRYQGPVD